MSNILPSKVSLLISFEVIIAVFNSGIKTCSILSGIGLVEYEVLLHNIPFLTPSSYKY